MKNTQRRAFILNECNSPYITQAIFILRDGVSAEESGVLAEAERIVAAYMRSDIRPQPAPGSRSKHMVRILCLAAVITAAAAGLALFKLIW